jgi:hypothetical protein
VVFADPSRQTYDYQEIFVGKPQPEGAPTKKQTSRAY